MFEALNIEIKKIRKRFGLSLAQFGSMLDAPAITVKRWEQGRKPQDRFLFQTILILGLINDCEGVYYDLGRQGVVLDKKHWDGFAALVIGAKNSIETASEVGLPEPRVDGALVSGVMGLLGLIATAFAAKNELGAKAGSSFATRIAAFLK